MELIYKVHGLRHTNYVEDMQRIEDWEQMLRDFSSPSLFNAHSEGKRQVVESYMQLMKSIENKEELKDAYQLFKKHPAKTLQVMFNKGVMYGDKKVLENVKILQNWVQSFVIKGKKEYTQEDEEKKQNFLIVSYFKEFIQNCDIQGEDKELQQCLREIDSLPIALVGCLVSAITSREYYFQALDPKFACKSTMSYFKEKYQDRISKYCVRCLSE